MTGLFVHVILIESTLHKSSYNLDFIEHLNIDLWK